MAWFAIDCNTHTNPKIFDLAAELRLDIDTLVGKLARLWSWAAQTENVTGFLGKIPPDEIAAIMRWNKNPKVLLTALLKCGFVDQSDDGFSIHDWPNHNGKHIANKLKDRARKSGG